MGISKNIATRWPVVKGLVAGTTSQTGNKEFLEPEFNVNKILSEMNTMINVGTNDHTQLINIGTNTHAQIDTALASMSTLALGETDSTAYRGDRGKTAYDHSQDNTQAHSDYLLNSGADEAVGPLTITADNSTADQAYVPMVLYNTDATPPTASGFPIGTIYIQYTP